MQKLHPDAAAALDGVPFDAIHLPGLYVERMVVGIPYDKKIECRTVRADV